MITDIEQLFLNAGVELSEGKTEYTDNSNVILSPATKNVFGDEITIKNNEDAISALFQNKEGFIRKAFHRKDIGDIALAWGNNQIGISHIIDSRKKNKQPIRPLLQDLKNVVEQGTLEREDNGDFIITLKTKIAIIRPFFDNDNLQFLLTAYYVYGSTGRNTR